MKHVTKLPLLSVLLLLLLYLFHVHCVHIYAVLFLFANTVVYTKLLYALFRCLCRSKHSLVFFVLFSSRFFFRAHLHANFHTTRCCSKIVVCRKFYSTKGKMCDGSDCRIFQSQRVHWLQFFHFCLFYWFNSFHCDFCTQIMVVIIFKLAKTFFSSHLLNGQRMILCVCACNVL